MIRGVVAFLAVGAASASMQCPGSKAWGPHAKCQITASLSSSCSDVSAEIIARTQGTNGWCDPHNKGTYTVDSQSSTSISIHRKTGNGQYTDKMILTLTASSDGKSCTVEGCSESQVTSVLDYGTNYCNLHDLYCGSKDGCRVAAHDLVLDKESIDCSSGQHDASTCRKTCGPSAETSSAVKLALAAGWPLATKELDPKAVGCCGKKITGGKTAVESCMTNLCSASSSYKATYCSETPDTVSKLAACAGGVASCSLTKCALHCLAGSCNDACTKCVADSCDATLDSCLSPLGYTHPGSCDTSLKQCSASTLRGRTPVFFNDNFA